MGKWINWFVWWGWEKQGTWRREGQEESKESDAVFSSPISLASGEDFMILMMLSRISHDAFQNF